MWGTASVCSIGWIVWVRVWLTPLRCGRQQSNKGAIRTTKPSNRWVTNTSPIKRNMNKIKLVASTSYLDSCTAAHLEINIPPIIWPISNPPTHSTTMQHPSKMFQVFFTLGFQKLPKRANVKKIPQYFHRSICWIVCQRKNYDLIFLHTKCTIRPPKFSLKFFSTGQNLLPLAHTSYL